MSSNFSAVYSTVQYNLVYSNSAVYFVHYLLELFSFLDMAQNMFNKSMKDVQAMDFVAPSNRKVEAN